MQIGLLLTYPVLVHVGVIFEQPKLQILAIITLALGVFFNQLKSYKLSAWFIVLVISLVSIGLGLFDKSRYLLFLPPAAAPLLIGWGFLRTLRVGQIPLVTDIGERARGPLSEAMRGYTRVVTQLWSGCLLLMASWGILLPIFGSMELWSFFTNIINQLLVACLFIGEFYYRKSKFQDHDHPRFLEYLRIVFRAQSSRD